MRRMIPLAFFLLAACGGGARSTDAVNPDPDMRAASRSQASPAIVLDWNAIAADVIVTQNARPPFTSYYYLAMTHVATYDAVNAIGGTGGRYQPLVVTLGEREGASREAAAISAAYQTLIGLPLTQASKDYATGKYNEALAAIKDGTHKTNGIAVGAEVATALLAAYPAAIPPSTYTLLPPGPGVWEPVPPSFGIAAPGFARMKPSLDGPPFTIPAGASARTHQRDVHR